MSDGQKLFECKTFRDWISKQMEMHTSRPLSMQCICRTHSFHALTLGITFITPKMGIINFSKDRLIRPFRARRLASFYWQIIIK
jgi:hypothetical protein